MADPGRAVILVAALADEMRPVVAALRKAGIKPAAVCRTGVGEGAATSAVRGILDRWVGPMDQIIHLGFAGGLDRALSRGAVVRFGWITNAAGDKIVLDETSSQGLLTLPEPLREPVDKRRWLKQTGAVAVDQETHALAALARERGLPLTAIRAITDTAEDRLPAHVERWVDPGGRSRPIRVVADLLRRPADLPAVIRLGLASGRAGRALAAAVLAELQNTPPPE